VKSSKICLYSVIASAMALAGMLLAGPVQSAPAQDTAQRKPLDYEFFKARIEPIFLKRRPGHARCYACHASGTGPQYLVPMSAGSSSWSEDQSRRIFRNVSALVDRDDPDSSLFLVHPLSPMAGGDIKRVHGGGRQFASKDDPDWKTIEQWVKGGTLQSSAAK